MQWYKDECFQQVKTQVAIMVIIETDRLTETVVASTLLAYGHMTSRRRPLFSNTVRNESHVPSDPDSNK